MLISANQIAQIGSRDRSRIPIHDLVGTVSMKSVKLFIFLLDRMFKMKVKMHTWTWQLFFFTYILVENLLENDIILFFAQLMLPIFYLNAPLLSLNSTLKCFRKQACINITTCNIKNYIDVLTVSQFNPCKEFVSLKNILINIFLPDILTSSWSICQKHQCIFCCICLFMAEIECDKPFCDITEVVIRVTNDSVWETIRSPDPMGQ